MSTNREPHDDATGQVQDLSPEASEAEGVKGGMDLVFPKATTPVIRSGGSTGGPATTTSTDDGGFKPTPQPTIR